MHRLEEIREIQQLSRFPYFGKDFYYYFYEHENLISF